MAEDKNNAKTGAVNPKQPSSFEEIKSSVKAIQTGDFRASNKDKYKERSESRRKEAAQREQARLEKINSVPTEMKAKEAALIGNKLKNAPTFWKYKVVLGNRFVRDATLEAMPHLDDVYNFINYNIPALIKNKRRIQAIQVQLGSRLKDLKEYNELHKDSILKLYKQYGLNYKSLIDDPNLQRITPPMEVTFTISSPHSMLFLRQCSDIDNVLAMEEYLVMFGFIQEGVFIRDARALQNAIRGYTSVILKTYTEFNKKLEEAGLRKRKGNSATTKKTPSKAKTEDKKSSEKAEKEPTQASKQTTTVKDKESSKKTQKQ